MRPHRTESMVLWHELCWCVSCVGSAGTQRKCVADAVREWDV